MNTKGKEIEMNILILTGKFGMGHYSASASLQQQIKSSYPNATIVTKDIFEYSVPYCSNAIYNGFTLLVNKGRSMYNYFYKITENSRTNIRPIFLSYFLYKLNVLIEDTQPDIIISTLPFCSQIVSRYKSKHCSAIPLITCITDISSHSEWINEFTTSYLVGSDSLKEKLILKGVPKEKIFVNGIPVKAEFKINTPTKNSEFKNLLIMGGGLGLLPKDPHFYETLNKMSNVKTTVITGNNHQIYTLLNGKYENINVIGYTNEVYKYMLEADVVVSKPGGITLFESIFSETPLLVFTPLLQQEKSNTSFILSNHIGKVIGTTSEQWLRQIEEVIHDNAILNELRANLIKLKNEIDSTSVQKVLFALEPPKRGIFAS